MDSETFLCCSVNPYTICGTCKGNVCHEHVDAWGYTGNADGKVSTCGNCFDIDRTREMIQQAIDANGEYSHNICSLNLRRVSRFKGRKVANKLIDEFELDDIYKIMKEPE